MDPNDENLSEPFSEDTSQPHPAPVMDVVPPPTSASASTPAKAEADPIHLSEHKPEAKHTASTQQPKPGPSKQPNNSVTAAIFATVVIVLGLAGLAVFAYLKS